MLRQIYVILKDEIIYQKHYGKGLDASLFENILPKIKTDAFSNYGSEINAYDFFKFKISYIVDKDLNLMIIFVSGLTDNYDRIKIELSNLKNDLVNFHGNAIKDGVDIVLGEDMEPILDAIHRNLRPKISIVGFAGVGKTTITNLIKSEEIPMEHIPTITGDVATIKLGKLHFLLWDFAGQEQYSHLWTKFIRKSDAVLLITDSSFDNVEKSKYFKDLISQEAPHSSSAIIGNKQDLTTAIDIGMIENLMEVKAYPMIAIEKANKIKIIRIIAELLEIDPEVSTLLKPLFDREKLISYAKEALDTGNLKEALNSYKKVSELCIEVGDETMALEYQEKFTNLNNLVDHSVDLFEAIN